jgi:hypothetical protein
MMNERIEELVDECKALPWLGTEFNYEKFAELLALEMADIVIDIAPANVAVKIVDELYNRFGIE